jgi:protein MpaA
VRVPGLLSALALLIGVLSPTPLAAADGTDGAVIEREVIGLSVQGRPIVAFHLGRPGKPKAVVIAAMHGNEPAARQILYALKNGERIHELDLWVIPTYNPDGFAAGTRQNANGVDLNRNFPYHWIEQDGATESGPAPGSEPETQAVMAFLDRERPRWIVSFHQPLHGVDRDTKWRNFSHKLSRYLDLPLKDFVCGGVCHGTMTSWFNHRYAGAAVTVEYGTHPGHHRMTVTAPRQLVRALGGWRG